MRIASYFWASANGHNTDHFYATRARSYWCYGSDCHDPVPGASEIDKYQQSDMGLSDDDIQHIAVAWRASMDAVHKALLKNKAFAWDMFPNQKDAGCGSGPEISKSSCDAILSRECAGLPEPSTAQGLPYRKQALYCKLGPPRHSR